jgi:PhoPQ-activated pathogenicity-related protein
MKDENASDVISQTSGDILWQYDTLTNKWKVYTQDSELKVLLQPYYNNGIFEKLDTLKKGSAVWVYIK